MGGLYLEKVTYYGKRSEEIVLSLGALVTLRGNPPSL